MASPKGLVFWRSKCPYRKEGGAALRFFRTNRSRGKKRVVTNEMGQREVNEVASLLQARAVLTLRLQPTVILLLNSLTSEGLPRVTGWNDAFF